MSEGEVHDKVCMEVYIRMYLYVCSLSNTENV